MLLPVKPIEFPVDSKYNYGDYIFAKDENKVLRIVAMATETMYAAYYLNGGVSRYFKTTANHYRMATKDEVDLAQRGVNY